MNVENLPQQDDLTTLRLLEELERDPSLSQREISRRLGVSLGLTNLLLSRMVRKAWIKIRTMPGRRLLYAVTPRGFAEKIRKTRDFARLSFRYYADLKQSLIHRIRSTDRQRPRVASFGAGELSAIVLEAAREGGGRYVGSVETDARDPGADIIVLFTRPLKPQADQWKQDRINLIDLS